MTRCCKCHVNLKSSVYNQTGESYVDQVSQHRRMCLHFRRIIQARCVVESRNPRYSRAIMQRRCRPTSSCRLRFSDPGCPPDDIIDRLAYDSQHHPAEIIRLSCHNKNSSKDRSCSRCRQHVSKDTDCQCIQSCKDQYRNLGKSSIDNRPRSRGRDNSRDKHCKDEYSPRHSVRSRRSSISDRQDDDCVERVGGGETRRTSPGGNRGCSPETFRDIAERKEEEACYAKFVYDITQDIVQHGLYTDRELKEVFERHIERNSGRLSKRKMLYEIYQLKISLNMTEDEEEEDEEDEVEADLVYAARFSALRAPKPPTPPKVLNENKVIERLAALGCEEAAAAAGSSNGASSPACRGVVLVEPNPEFLITERDVLASLADERVSPEQIQRIYRSLCRRSRNVSLCEPVQVGHGIAYAHRLKRVDRCSSAPSLDKVYMAEHLKSILRKEATDYSMKSLSPTAPHRRYYDMYYQQDEALEKCAKWKLGIYCDCEKQPCKKHMELPERDKKSSSPRRSMEKDVEWYEKDRRCSNSPRSSIERERQQTRKKELTSATAAAAGREPRMKKIERKKSSRECLQKKARISTESTSSRKKVTTAEPFAKMMTIPPTESLMKEDIRTSMESSKKEARISGDSYKKEKRSSNESSKKSKRGSTESSQKSKRGSTESSHKEKRTLAELSPMVLKDLRDSSPKDKRGSTESSQKDKRNSGESTKFKGHPINVQPSSPTESKRSSPTESKRSSGVSQVLIEEKRDSEKSKRESEPTSRAISSFDENDEIEEEIETDIDDQSSQKKYSGKSSPIEEEEEEEEESDKSISDEDDEDNKMLSTVREERKSKRDSLDSDKSSDYISELSDKDLATIDSPKSALTPDLSPRSTLSSPRPRVSGKVNGVDQQRAKLRMSTIGQAMRFSRESEDSNSSPTPSSYNAAAAMTTANEDDDDEDDTDYEVVAQEMRKRNSSGMSGYKVVDTWNRRLSEVTGKFYRASEARYCEPGCRSPENPRSCSENCKFVRTNCRNLSNPTECLVQTRHKSESSSTTSSS